MVRMPRRPECSGSWKPDCSWIRSLRTGAWKPVRGELWETAMTLGCQPGSLCSGRRDDGDEGLGGQSVGQEGGLREGLLESYSSAHFSST